MGGGTQPRLLHREAGDLFLKQQNKSSPAKLKGNTLLSPRRVLHLLSCSPPSHTPFIQPLSFPAALLGCWSFVPSSQEEGHSFPCMAVCLRPLSSQEGHLPGRVPPSLTRVCLEAQTSAAITLEADSFPAGFTQRLSIKETSLGGAGCSLLHVALNTTAQGTGSTSFPF